MKRFFKTWVARPIKWIFSWVKKLLKRPICLAIAIGITFALVPYEELVLGLLIAGFPEVESKQLNVFVTFGWAIFAAGLWYWAFEAAVAVLAAQMFKLVTGGVDSFKGAYSNARLRGYNPISSSFYGSCMLTWNIFGEIGDDLLSPAKRLMIKRIKRARRKKSIRRVLRARKAAIEYVKEKLDDPPVSPIEDRNKFPELPELKGHRRHRGLYWVEEHDADRAGLHYDITIQMPPGHQEGGKYYRLATKPTKQRRGALGIFPGPGEKAQWILQPVHYKPTNPPIIKEGYGKGTCRTVSHGKAFVWFGHEGMLHFQLQGIDGRYVLIRSERYGPHKEIVMRLPERPVPDIPKPKMKQIKLGSSEFDELIKGDMVMVAKKDGARCNIRVSRDKKGNRSLVSIGSYREDKRLKKKYGVQARIDYSDKLRVWEWDIDPGLDFKGSGEVWVPNDPHMNKVNQCLQQDPVKGAKWTKKYHPRVYLHDIQEYQGEDVSNLPYREKLKLLEEIRDKSNHRFKVPPYAVTEQGKKSLLKKVRKEPGVDGIVFDGHIKTKWREDITGTVVGIQSEVGPMGGDRDTAIPVVKWKGKQFPIAGRLTQEEKRDIKLNPNRYIGRELDFSYTRLTHLGSPFQPVFERWKP